GSDPQDSRPGIRRDGRNLTQEWTDRFPNASFVSSREQLEAVDTTNTDHLLGLFSRSHMSFRMERSDETNIQPSLPLMTETALRILQKNDKGYFLMIEGGRIDHGHHAGNAARALDDARELSAAVQTALQMTDPSNTLIIVTADHSHPFTIAGYPTRGNPILGKVVGNDRSGVPATGSTLDVDELPYTTLGYRTGRGF